MIMKQYDKAEQHYSKAIEVASMNTRAYYGRAAYYIYRQKVREALYDLNQALSINPEFHQVRLVLGEFCSQSRTAIDLLTRVQIIICSPV